MTTTTATPRVYVACLSSYCNSKLHGAWIDCDQDSDSIQAEIDEMLACSPEPDAEEWAVHCFENWQGINIDEHESVERLAELAELLEEHGKAFALYCEYYGNDATAEDFQEYYIGQYKDEEDFVYEMWEQEGKIKELEKLGIPTFYIDWGAIARDWFIDSYFSAKVSYDVIHVFSRH